MAYRKTAGNQKEAMANTPVMAWFGREMAGTHQTLPMELQEVEKSYSS
jgi:hypothetical protein